MTKPFLEKLFKLDENNTTVRTEIIAGVTTFMTMAYIIIVNPAILESGANMDPIAVAEATCVSAAIATLIMALWANYPIALAPGMGLNAYFSYEICAGHGVDWRVGLGIVFISGLVFTLLTLCRIRSMIVDAIPKCLKLSTAVGIGIFIAFIGLEHSGIVVSNKATYVTLGELQNPAAILSLIGLIVTATLVARGVRGAILWGILFTGAIGFGSEMFPLKVKEIVSVPTFQAVGQMDILSSISKTFLPTLFILLFIDMFDTIGTLVGVGEQSGLMKDGKLPRADRALLSDSVGTMVGAAFGTSTVTSYIESSAGVAEGGRTGLASVVTALMFLLALFFLPAAGLLGQEYMAAGMTAPLYPVTAPALIIVGCFMMKNVRKIEWDDMTEAIPAFITIILMPLTFSIAHGLSIGFISYPLIKLLSGRGREVHWLVYSLAALLMLRYILLPV